MPFDGTMLKQDEVVRVLQDARDIIKKKGWCRFTVGDIKGRHCTLGAIITAVLGKDIRGLSFNRDNLSPQQRQLYSQVLNRVAVGAILKEHPDAGYPTNEAIITGWNDVSGRRKNEVLAMFDKAIAEERGDAL